MRSGTTGDVPLVTITDHWIQKRPPPIAPGPVARPRTLVPWSTLIGDPVGDAEMPALTALAHADAGLGDEAVRLAVTAVAKRPSAALYELIANALIARHRPQEAGHAYRSALRLEPDRASALLGYARVMLDGGRIDEAMRAFDRLLAIDPSDVASLETKGIFLYRGGDRAHAFELFRRAAATGRATAASYVALAVEARSNRTQELEWLEQAWRAEPRDRWILDELDAAAAAIGDKKRIAELARRRAAVERLTPTPAITHASNWLR
jgi:tetratricopeptide (TPR) repeat protein